MKKIDELMEELGFRKEASDDVKMAFVKNLMRAAYGVEIPGPQKNKPKPVDSSPKVGEQLSFQLDPVDPVQGLFPKRKSS